MMRKITTMLLTGLAAGSGAVAAEDAFPAPEEIIIRVEDQYPALSPDGEWIAFESRRADGTDHIFVAPAAGGAARQLTRAAEDDETPVWSPDGGTILFARRLGEGRAAQLDIFAMNADGSNVRNLSANADGHDDHHKYSADGRRIVFNSSRRTPLASLSDEAFENYGWDYDIWLMNADGSDQRPLIELPGWDTYPSLSPDGTALLWRRVLEEGARNSEIFIAKADGSAPKNISNHAAFDGYPAWSPDGEWVLFASNRDGEGEPKSFSLYVMRPDGSDVRRLSDPGPGAEDVRPMWSADGASIIFNRDAGGATRIMVLESDL